MNNKILIAVFGVLILGGIGFLIISSQDEQTVDQTSQQVDSLNSPRGIEDNDAIEEESMQNGSQVVSPGEELSSNGRYITFSDTAFNQASDKRRVLFFFANWCPTCIPADQEFKDNAGQIPDDVVLIRVHYNDDQTEPFEEELADQYGVTYQHTFVQVDESGEEVAKWNGGAMDELLQNIKS